MLCKETKKGRNIPNVSPSFLYNNVFFNEKRLFQYLKRTSFSCLALDAEQVDALWKRSASEGGAHVAHRASECVNSHAAGIDNFHFDNFARLDGADACDVLLILGSIAAHVEDALVDAAGVPVVIDGEFWQVELECACDVHRIGFGPHVEGVWHFGIGGQVGHVRFAYVGCDSGSGSELQRANVGDVCVIHRSGCSALAQTDKESGCGTEGHVLAVEVEVAGDG